MDNISAFFKVGPVLTGVGLYLAIGSQASGIGLLSWAALAVILEVTQR